MKHAYRVVGNHKDGYAVLEDNAILYDLVKTKRGAEAIRNLLKKGLGPEWDKLEPLLSAAGEMPEFI